jgi:putative membrane protein
MPFASQGSMEEDMKKLVILLAGAAALGACATNNVDDMDTAGTTGTTGTTAVQTAGVDANNPLFHPMYMMMSASSDQFEIQSSQLALQASQNQAVRNYANLMIAHHQATTANLVSAAQSAGLTPPPPTLMPMHAQMLQQLQAAGTGAALDAAYKQLQIQSHTEALNLQTNYANGGDVPALRQVAASTAPIVQQHLQQAQVLNVDGMMNQGMMNQGTTGGNQSGSQGGASRAGERG